MSELALRMEAIKAAFAAQVPQRVVTRDLLDPAQRSSGDLRNGVYTILSTEERDYTNIPGFNAQNGRQGILIVGDLLLAENDPPSKVEDAEFAMRDEIVEFVRNLPQDLCVLNLLDIQQSGQFSHPYGWIVAKLEYVP